MKRREAIKSSLLALGGAAIGSSLVYKLMSSSAASERHLLRPPVVQCNTTRRHSSSTCTKGSGKNVLVLQSGIKNGNTDHLTDAISWAH